MGRSPESRPGIVQFVSRVGEFVRKHPVGGVIGSAVITAAMLHEISIATEAWTDAGPDVWLQPSDSPSIVYRESPERAAKRQEIMASRHQGEINGDLAGILVGISLVIADAALRRRRPRPNLPLALV